MESSEEPLCCFFCKDPVFKRLPCGHRACSLCIVDLVTDGSVCRAHPEDCFANCNVPFLAEEVLSPVLEKEEPKTEEVHKAFENLKVSIEEQKFRVGEIIDVLETLYMALYEHKNTFPKEAEEGRKAVEADMKTIGLRCDELKVYLEHLCLAETAFRMKQLMANPSKSCLPIHFTTAIAESGLVKVPLQNLFPKIGFAVFARDYTKIIVEPKLVFGVYGSKEGQLDYPFCAIFDKDNNILVGEGSDNQRIQVFNQQGQYVRIFATNLGSLTSGMALAHDGNVWLSLCHNNTLQLRNGATGDLIRSIALQDRPWGISLLADGTSLAVTLFNGRKVILLNVVDGTHRWTSAGNGQFSNYLYGMTIVERGGASKGLKGLKGSEGSEAQKGLVFVCDSDNNQLQVLSLEDGSFVRTIGGHGPNGMNCPSSVTFDPKACVLLVSEIGKVSVWSLDGNKLHSWGCRGSRPAQFHFAHAHGITISPLNGSVWIVDAMNNRIQMF